MTNSGSTDGSVELIRKAQPRYYIQIRPEEYSPSRVMNRGMELARAEFSIFLNADATPQCPNWLPPFKRVTHWNLGSVLVACNVRRFLRRVENSGNKPLGQQ